MKSERVSLISRFTLGILTVGIVTAGVYHYFSPTIFEKPTVDLVSQANDSDTIRHKLANDIKQLNKKITELQKSSTIKPPANMELQVTQLQGEMQSLRNQLKAVADNVASHQQSLKQTADERQDAELTEDEKEQQFKAEVEEQLMAIDGAAQVEGVDPKWAPTAKADVLKSFQTLSKEGVGVSNVKCHTSFCQAGFHLDSENLNASLQKIQSVSPWQGETMVWIENAEQGEGVVYLARNGYRLPQNGSASR